ncbi:MAG TPA: ATP-dependent Clp protease proteolytic subunit [Flavobacteriales bacterium]|nr:ATP-dependent Clp protease proteolytic subunit [Flavobacteriales bacterium]
MAKRPLNITALRSGNHADVRVEGVIATWDKANARDLGLAIDGLVASGVRDAHVYIDSEGGSVLEAKRIALALRKFPGRLTGEGGAAVLSAATYLGLKLDEFRVRKDTAYMIHKPMAAVEGNEDQVKADLKMLEDITKEYRALYAAKLGKTEDEVEALWNKGDKWYTGAEAVAEGFVDGLVDDDDDDEEQEDDVLFDQEAVARIAACGCPVNKLPKAREAKIKAEQMDIKAMRALLGMPESAPEAEVLARVEALKKENERHMAAAEALRKAEVKSILDKAIAEKKLTEAHRASYEAKFTAAFDATKAEVEALAAAPSVAREVRDGAAAGAAATPKGREAWTYKQWAEKDMKGLQAMMAKEPERFTALYEEHYGKKPVLA